MSHSKTKILATILAKIIQITLGLPEHKEYFVINAIRHPTSLISKDKHPAKLRLPVTPSILHKLKAHWSRCYTNTDNALGSSHSMVL